MIFYRDRYKDIYAATQSGSISITLNTEWVEPLNPEDPEDVKAAERYLQSEFGWFAHPIFVNGDYPELLKGKFSIILHISVFLFPN